MRFLVGSSRPSSALRCRSVLRVAIALKSKELMRFTRNKRGKKINELKIELQGQRQLESGQWKRQQ